MKKTYQPTKKFQCIWTTLQSRVISFEKVPGIYDTHLEVSSDALKFLGRSLRFLHAWWGFFLKKTH
jgi:hypothetical protein